MAPVRFTAICVWLSVFLIVLNNRFAAADPGGSECVESTYWSPYDLRTGFTDERDHLVTATLKNVQFKEMTALSFCFNIKKEIHNMDPIIFMDSEKNPVITFGYREFFSLREMYVRVGEDDMVFDHEYYFEENYIFGFCVTWSGESGSLTFYDSEKTSFKSMDNIGKGFKIPANGQLKIYQQQYLPLDEENPLTGFTYTVADFYMWDRKLTEDEVSVFWECSGKTAPFLVAPAFAEWNVDEEIIGTCDDNKFWSSYDLRTGFEDGRHHYVTATLNNAEFEEMTELSFCFNIYKEMNNMEPIMIINGYDSIMMYGYRETNDVSFAEIYVNVGDVRLSSNDETYLKNGTLPICVTWNGKYGRLTLFDYEDNVLSYSSVEGIGSDFKIPANSQLQISQEQYAPLNEEKPLEGFSYTVADFYMWNRELTQDDVKSFFKCSGSALPFLIAPDIAKWDVDDRLALGSSDQFMPAQKR